MAKKPSHEALVMRHDCEASFSQLFNLYARNRANESQFSSHGCFRSKGSVLRTARPSPIDFCYISKTGSGERIWGEVGEKLTSSGSATGEHVRRW